MYSQNSAPYLRIKKKRVNDYTSRKTKCIQLKKDIYNFINLIRKEPSKIIELFEEAKKDPNFNENFETQQIFTFINNLQDNNISLAPLIEKSEITKISYDLLNYIINKMKTEGIIKCNNLDEEYINLRIRAAPYGRIIGKYYEGIVLDGVNLLEIISYLMRDVKGRNMLFNEKIKYIGIACGYIENKNNIFYKSKNNKICTIIDMIQDFELNNLSYNNIRNETFRNKTPEIFMRVKTVFNEGQYINYDKKNVEKKNIDKKSRNLVKFRNYNRTQKDSYDINKSFDIKKIIVRKSPLLNYCKNKNNTSINSPSLCHPKSKNENSITPIASYISKIKDIKISSTNNNKNKNISNIYVKNPSYFSSETNFYKNKKNNNKKYILENISEKKDINFVSLNNSGKIKKKLLNRKEKIELLKQINKVSRDKSIKKSKSFLKSDDDSRSASFKTKKKYI